MFSVCTLYELCIQCGFFFKRTLKNSIIKQLFVYFFCQQQNFLLTTEFFCLVYSVFLMLYSQLNTGPLTALFTNIKNSRKHVPATYNWGTCSS